MGALLCVQRSGPSVDETGVKAFLERGTKPDVGCF